MRRPWWPTVLLGLATLVAWRMDPHVQVQADPAGVAAAARPCLRYGNLECCYGQEPEAERWQELAWFQVDHGATLAPWATRPAADRCARYGDLECCYGGHEGGDVLLLQETRSCP